MQKACQVAMTLKEQVLHAAELRHTERRESDERILAALERAHAKFVDELRTSHAQEKAKINNAHKMTYDDWQVQTANTRRAHLLDVDDRIAAHQE